MAWPRTDPVLSGGNASGVPAISGIYGWSGMAVDFTLRCRGAAYDPECDCREAEASVPGNHFKGRHFEASLILQAVCRYLQLSPELPRH